MSDIRVKKDTDPSLRELLARYDGRVQEAFRDVAATSTGTTRVQALHHLNRVMSAHDSVVGSALCPLLRALPGGPEVAERLRQGCDDRAALLGRFQSLSQGTEAHNVYPVFGEQIETILAGLERSFDHHVEDETTRVGELLEAAATSIDPQVVAAKMAIEATRAPARVHRTIYRHPSSKTLRALYRSIDRMHEWNDSHHGWPSDGRQAARPVRPRRTFARRPPSIRELLSGYDETVEAAITDVVEAGQDSQRLAVASYQLAASIAVHDSVVGGTLCQVLGDTPEGRPAADILRRGCQERSQLLERWNALTRHSSPADVFESRSGEANTIIERLIASFRTHEVHETGEVSEVVERLRARSWKSGGTGLISPYLVLDWPNPEPGDVAAHMALWADKAPTHSHPLLSKHPTNRLLRDFFRHVDHVRDWRAARRGWPTLR